jgi:cell division protein FtsB
MKKLKNILQRLRSIRGLKYVVVTVLAIILIGFVDENSWWRHMRNTLRINELQEEIDQYTDQYKQDKAKMDMLKRDPKAIEKIARERYFMKADGEDIFVLSDDNQTSNTKTDEDAE